MSPVIAETTGRLGHLTLNRPAALNALDEAMVRALDAALHAWAADDRVRAVLIEGAGERGLCAGGDVRALYHDIRAGGTGAWDFWAHEYRLNARIAGYPKPYVAFMDGLVMGGGVGVSAHGGVRVVTERTQLAMPEVRIGFVPDVGVTHLLARAPGQLGTHLALTGSTVTGADAIACGLADHFVPSASLPALRAALTGTDPADAVAEFAVPPPPAPLQAQADWIAACYAAPTVPEILDRLRGHGGAAAAAAAEIDTRSPTSLCLTLELLRGAAGGDLAEALDREFAAATVLARGHDFVEGVRAQLVDKDRSPRWRPATLAEVDLAALRAALAGARHARPRE
ncbi:3-hydroxyisobutyryl-CoA hydrolase [Pilimelia terevasa]|uniref:3-hydroxyisobutyryl-CoA hydrolase n=1 Tax=Pilimelia terevasa TaxID=53372 RepID=A0A8J3FJU2_9ACTN|nr:enoyl-CoA hydratase/isomerase family protein [Pilimelia terevasa]GGK42877.1 3-hydroxyisobutyryl-CoA hydrolase [Pilimelia terevasa]